MTASDGKQALPRAPRRLRRTVRVLWRVLLVFVMVSAAVWFFRQQLIAPLLLPRLEAAIASLLGAERVSIGVLGGDWLGELDARDVVVEGGAPPLRALRGGRVEARYSLFALLRGDPAGLHALAVTGTEADLDVRPARTASAGAEEATDASLGRSFATWLRFLPGGASVRVADLRVLAPRGERRGALAVGLEPGPGQRRLVGSFAGWEVEATAAAGGSAPDRLPLQVSCAAEDPGALLDLFGLGAGVRGGTMRARFGVGFEPLLLQGSLELADLVHGGERLASSHVTAQLDRQRLAIDSASLDLPGVAVEVHELALPSPLSGAGISLAQLAGRFVVRIDDLAPHASLLPVLVQDLLPIQGRLAGSASEGMLRLAASELRTRGAVLRIESGSVPLVSDDWRAAEGAVRFGATFGEFSTRLPWLGATSVSGRIAGSVAGSLTQPRIEGDLDLGECRSERGWFASAQGLVSADADAAAVQGLRVRGLGAAAFGSSAPTEVELDASCRFRAGRVDPDSLVAALSVGSLVPGDLLAPLFAAHGLGAPLAGITTLELRVRHDASGIAVDSLRLRTAQGSPMEIAIDGEGVLPLHGSWRAAPAPPTAGTLVLRASARRPAASGDAAAFAFDGTLRVGARSVELSQFEVAVGPARVRGGIALADGVASLFDPAADLAAAPLQVALDLDRIDLATLPAAWIGAIRLRGSAAGRLRTAGSLRALSPELLLTLADGEMSGAGLPALASARLRLEVTAGDPAANAILVTASGSARLCPELGIDQEASFGARVRCDESGTQLEPTVLKVGGGELSIELASDLRRSELLAGAFDGRRTVAGTVRLHEFALEKLPPRLLGLASCRGIASGEAVLDGTLGAPSLLSILRTGHVAVRDGEFKVGDLPRLERLAIDLRGDRRELILHSMTGVLGAGRFSAQGSLRGAGAPLDEAFADASLDLRFDGEDVLLYRGEGAKVRATVRATAAGPLRSVAVRGDVLLGRGSKYVRRISVLPALATQGGAAAVEGLHLGGLPPAIGDCIDLDVAIATREPVEVRTHVVDGDVDVVAHLRGKASGPRLEGTMAMRRGMLRFPGANLAIESALLTFTPSEPAFPELLVSATGRRMGIVVSLAVTGRYDRPQFQLSSVPALPPQDLIVLLTTGQLPNMITEGGAVGQARFLGGYLAKEVFEKYFGSESTERGASPFDRLTIETGREVSQNGTESVLVEYELLPRFSVRAERDAYEDYNLGLVLRFRFR